MFVEPVASIYHPETTVFGSGYRIGPRLVLTACHVLKPPRGPAPKDGYNVCFYPCLDTPFTASLKTECSSDIALLCLDERQKHPLPELPVRTTWGALAFGSVRGELQCRGAGFPLVAESAMGDEVLEIVGTINPWQEKDGSFRMEVRQFAPKKDKDWGGVSGTAIFVAGHLVAIIDRACPRHKDGVLLIRPLAPLFDDDKFREILAKDGIAEEPDWLPHIVPDYNAPGVSRPPDAQRRARVAEILNLIGRANFTKHRLTECYLRSLPDPAHALRTDRLTVMVSDLCDQWDDKPVSGFVLRLRPKDSAVKQWVKDTVGAQALDQLEETLKREEKERSKPVRLIVCLPRPEDDGVVTTRLLLPAPMPSLDEEFRGCSLQNALLAAVERAEQLVPSLEIDIFAPLKDLVACDADATLKDLGSGLVTTLGQRHSVSLRWRERAEYQKGTRPARWEKVARDINDRYEKRSGFPLFPVEAGRSYPLLMTDLEQATNRAPCLLFPFASRRDTVILEALQGGMPYALWPRGEGDADAFARRAAEKAKSGRLAKFPETCRNWRCEDQDTSFTLFFDDPDTNFLHDAGLYSMEQ